LGSGDLNLSFETSVEEFVNQKLWNRISISVQLDDGPFESENTNKEESFDLEKTMTTIRTMLIEHLGNRYLGDLLKMRKEFKYYNEFIDAQLEFKPSRITVDEFSNRLIGLLIWDSVQQGLNIKDASVQYLSKISKKDKNKSEICVQNSGKCEACDKIEDCERTARHLYTVAEQSINDGKIATSRKK
jgi:hypothetical protein